MNNRGAPKRRISAQGYVKAFAAASLIGGVTGGVAGLELANGNFAAAIVTTPGGFLIGFVAGLLSISVAAPIAIFLSRFSQHGILRGIVVACIAGAVAAGVVAVAFYVLPPNSSGIEDLIWLTLIIGAIVAGLVHMCFLRATEPRNGPVAPDSRESE